MDIHSKKVLELAGILFDKIEDIDEQMVPRELFLSYHKYEQIKLLIPELKTHYSSSEMTCLHKNAETTQKWPFLNIVRQVLNRYKFKMLPIRKSDGYTLDGIKKYKRFFKIKKTEI